MKESLMAHQVPCLPVTASTRCGRVSFYRLPGRSVVIFTGEIDVGFRDGPFEDVVKAVGAAGQPVYVDCAAVRFFGAEGLRMLERLVEVAADHRLAAVVMSRAVQAVVRFCPIEGYTSAA